MKTIENYIERKNCIMCNSESIKTLHTFSNFPVYMGTSLKSKETDIYCDKIIGICNSCGCVQMKNLIPLEILYENNHMSIVGKTWERHHDEFCNFVKKYVKGSVVEIGGSNLRVANILSKEKSVDKYIVFDNDIFKENKKSDKIKFRDDFFDPLKIDENIDVIVHTHLIEHLYDPMKEIRDMSNILKDGSYMLFASPMIDEMLKDNFTNAFNFEHSYVVSEEIIENILSYSKFEIVDTYQFSKYAKFYVAKKNSKLKNNIVHNYHAHKDIILNFINYHLNEVDKIKNSIDTSPESTFIFGAHIFTQYLIAFGLNENLFKNVLDNSVKKIGKRLYGTSLSVKSPKSIKDMKNPLIVLKAAQYTEEIKKDIIENINRNSRFIL